MQTSLPDLPCLDYGDAVLNASGIHSAAKSGPQKDPRTDLQTLTPWTSFLNDIHQAILATTHAHLLPTTPFHISGWTIATIVENKESIRTHAKVALHVLAEVVLRRLGVNGHFTMPGGDPNFSWVMSPGAQPHPKVIYKTWWAADLVNLVTAFNCTHDDALSQQSLHALKQTYGYMTFNNNRFGILTNWKHALFLCHAETPDCKTLTAWKDRKAAVGITERYHMQPINGAYQCLAIDFCLCHFDLSSACCGANVVDALCYPDAASSLDDEACAYAALQDLQGKEVWGILQFLALEPVSNAISEDKHIDQTLCTNMKVALQRIHHAGYTHGNIAHCNSCRTDSGDIFLVDLERCQPSGDPSELDDEMDQVDRL
ncbi:hypothetical protein L208DRAFT_1479798 [Tricholoma matsutake]|nr:hypothetical protein L208DRAFT_1479798 [Tricholoma matsutake 945]